MPFTIPTTIAMPEELRSRLGTEVPRGSRNDFVCTAVKELLNRGTYTQRERRDRALRHAEEWLRELLADGKPHRSKDIWRAAHAAGISVRTLTRAKANCGVVVHGGRTGWFWKLAPQTPPTS